MIIKGNARSRSAQLAAHLRRTDQNEQIELREVRGTVATDLLGALEEIEATAEGTRCSKPFYHASISPSPDEPLTARQWVKAINRLEAALGLKGQSRVVMAHVKGKREHVHVVWSRIDLERGKAITDSWNYRVHETVARELEREFGHETVRGAFTARDEQPRPKRTPKLYELRQEERSGIPRNDVQAELTRLWQSAATGEQFRRELERAGYVLARGDRRTFVVIDAAGEVHALARRIEGARSRDIKARFEDLKISELPEVGEARKTARSRLAPMPRQSDSPNSDPPIIPASFRNQKTRRDFRRVAGATTARNPNASKTPSRTSTLKNASGVWQDTKRELAGRRSKTRRASNSAQERGAILLLYASKLAAVELYSAPDQVAAIIAALKSEERAALRALSEREAVERQMDKRQLLVQKFKLSARRLTRKEVRPISRANRNRRPTPNCQPKPSR